MRKIIILIITLLLLQCACVRPLFAAGEIRKLTGIAENMKRMALQEDQEGKNYARAKDFISSKKIQEGLSKDDIAKACGEPVAVVDDKLRWVYKPPTSTFFKGEKIYFFFNKSGNLIDWEQVEQD